MGSSGFDQLTEVLTVRLPEVHPACRVMKYNKSEVNNGNFRCQSLLRPAHALQLHFAAGSVAHVLHEI